MGGVKDTPDGGSPPIDQLGSNPEPVHAWVLFFVFGMLIAVRWFRTGDPWAWLAFWVFPVLFAWGTVTTWAALLWLVLFVAAMGALVATYSQFFRRTTTS